jgi:hypothetical protein
MSQANLELVRRWYAAIPDVRDADLRDDRAWLDRAFREYLDERYELRLPPGYPEGEPVFRVGGLRDVPTLSAHLSSIFRAP